MVIHTQNFIEVRDALLAMPFSTGQSPDFAGAIMFNGDTGDGVCVGRHSGIWTVSIRRSKKQGLPPDRKHYDNANLAAAAILSREHAGSID
jgi:hypothetical protein